MKCFEILGIEQTTDKRQIRHAYAALVKEHHVETDPVAFAQIRDAYEQALEYCKAAKEEGKEIWQKAEKEYRVSGQELGEEDKEFWQKAEKEYRVSRQQLGEEGRAFQQKLEKKYHVSDKDLENRTTIQQLDLDEIEIDTKKAEKEFSFTPSNGESIFYESFSLEHTYGNERLANIQNLKGLSAIMEDMEQKKAKGFRYFKDYVLSDEFLTYQYDRYYIKTLATLLTKYHHNYKPPQLVDLCLPIAIMYGFVQIDTSTSSSFENSYYEERRELTEYLNAEDMRPLQAFVQCYLDETFIYSRLKKPEIITFSIAANQYRILSVGYQTSYFQPAKEDWSEIVEKMKREIFVGYKLKNDFIFWKMLAGLIRNCPEIDKHILKMIVEQIGLDNIRRSSNKKAYEPLVQAIEEVTEKTVEQLCFNEEKNLTSDTLGGKEKNLTSDTLGGKEKNLTSDTLSRKEKKLTSDILGRKEKNLTSDTLGGKKKKEDVILAENMNLENILSYQEWKHQYDMLYFSVVRTLDEEEKLQQLEQQEIHVKRYWDEVEVKCKLC